jgi:PAS domain S-box-containing protein
MKANPYQRFYAVIAITGLVAVFFVLFIVFFQREENKRLAKDSKALLESVTHSKRIVLSDWLQDEIHDVKLISKNSSFVELIERFVDGNAKEIDLLSFFNQIKSEHGYAELVLLNEKGEHTASTNPALTFNDSIDKDIFAKALATDSCYVTDIFRSSIDQNVYIDLVTVIRNAFGRPLGGLIFKIHAEETIDKILIDENITGYKCLVSLIQQQPDEKWVIYKPDSTLAFNQEGWRPLPARFRNNPFHPQYRLVRLVEMANTPWYLMVELDNSQRKAENSTFLVITSLLGVFSVLLFLVGLLIIVYNQEKKYYHKLKSKDGELEQFKKQYFFTMDILGESVFITDNQGLIQYMNLSAELLSGWSLKDVIGKPLDKEISLLQEETGLPLLNVRNWFSGEPAYHQYMAANLVNKEGAYIRVICSLAPIEGKNSENDGLAVVLFKNDTNVINAPEPSERIKNGFSSVS